MDKQEQLSSSGRLEDRDNPYWPLQWGWKEPVHGAEFTIPKGVRWVQITAHEVCIDEDGQRSVGETLFFTGVPVGDERFHLVFPIERD